MKKWIQGDLGDFITLQRGIDLSEYERKTGDVPVVTSSGISDFHYEKQSRTLAVLRNALLPRLMSGEVRVVL